MKTVVKISLVSFILLIKIVKS